MIALALMLALGTSDWARGASLPRDEMAAYGACTARKYEKVARAYVLKAGEGWKSPQPYMVLGANACATGAVSFEPMIMAYILADALLKQEHLLDKAPAFENVAAIRHPWVESKFPKDASFRSASIMGECVARQSPAAACMLLSTRVKSAEESNAFAQLESTVGKCAATDADKFNATIVRGAVAVAYYRLMRVGSTARADKN